MLTKTKCTITILITGLLATHDGFAAEAENPFRREAFEPLWLKLLHYKSDGSNGLYRSDVRGKHFFISKNGSHDPEGELQASLNLLQADRASAYDFACNFPARTRWLTKVFPLEQALELWRCVNLERWKEEIGAKGVTLLFASSFMGSPSSMFGHTLLRFDSNRPPLLSYAVNFAAQVSTDDTLTFPIKGLTGQYAGGFSVMPYYQKLREYQHIEKREIWEYNLALTESEIETLVLHIWELKEISFPYYFLDENCGSKMLDILDVARPSLNFNSPRSNAVIPQDVLRTVVGKESLVGDIHVVSDRAELTPANGAESSAPNKGHASSNVEIGLSWNARSGHHVEAGEITIRGGYHNLLDPIEGYQAGVGIDFLALNLRTGHDSTRIASADLINLQSIQTDPQNAWSNSWRGGLGLSRQHDPHSLQNDALSLQAYYSTGYAKKVWPLVVFGQLDFRLAGSFEAASLGAGPRLGFLYQDKTGNSINGAATRRLLADNGHSITEIEISAGIKLHKNYTIVGQAFRTSGDTFHPIRKTMIGVRHYF